MIKIDHRLLEFHKMKYKKWKKNKNSLSKNNKKISYFDYQQK